MEQELTHIAEDGSVTMVDVGEKAESRRVAKAQGIIHLRKETLDLLIQKALPKGDAIACARIAGILAAKETPHLIPLCHPLLLTFVDIQAEILPDLPGIRLESEVRCKGTTGVEMEALIAVEVALATIYDMCKAVQRDMVIDDIRLLYKSGGRRGTYTAADQVQSREPKSKEANSKGRAQ